MNEMEEQVISISEIFEAIKKRWIIIVAITLTATIISGIISFFVIDPRSLLFLPSSEQYHYYA